MTKKFITPQDRELFRQAIGKVDALKSDKRHLKADNRPKPYPKPRQCNPEEALQDHFQSGVDTVGHEENLSYTAPGVQNNVITKLRKGFFGVQAELDLHGFTSESAKQQLLAFLLRSTTLGHRCVHVIHGKGYRSSDNLPVLKNNLNRWLRQHNDVQAFCSAPQRQGGAGAVYVLLKKAKDEGA